MKLRILFLLTLLCAAIASVQIVHAATFTVTNTGDDLVNPPQGAGTGTLRQAIVDANFNPGADTITFNVTGTIQLERVLPDLSDDVIISGPGADQLTVQRNPLSLLNFRVFAIVPGRTVTISGMTITNGATNGATPGGNKGGGIYNGHATLTISNCTLSGNSASSGGGIYNDGTVGSATLTITNCTLSSNTASLGGGIYNDGGAAALR